LFTDRKVGGAERASRPVIALLDALRCLLVVGPLDHERLVLLASSVANSIAVRDGRRQRVRRDTVIGEPAAVCTVALVDGALRPIFFT
jgi:hypothetical protein